MMIDDEFNLSILCIYSLIIAYFLWITENYFQKEHLFYSILPLVVIWPKERDGNEEDTKIRKQMIIKKVCFDTRYCWWSD